MHLYIITCWFKPRQDSDAIHGLAICSDPDTPITFIHPDGTSYVSDDIWDYSLKHLNPWMKIEVGG